MKKKTHGPNDVVVVWAAWARCLALLGAGGRGGGGGVVVVVDGGGGEGRRMVAMVAMVVVMVVGGGVMRCWQRLCALSCTAARVVCIVLRALYLQAPVVQWLIVSLVIIIFTMSWVRFPDMH
jgi:hypothetical protein